MAKKRDMQATFGTSGKAAAARGFYGKGQTDKMEKTFSESAVMAQELMQASPTASHVAGFDVVTSLSSRTLFWRPRFLRDAASLHHLPFLFWLIDTLRPKSFVSLGGGDGVVHFALCQAAEKLDLDARGYGFGPWGGALGGDGAGAVPADLARYNAETYPDGSRLSASDPQQAAGSFPAGSVDLLSVHLGHGADAAEHDARVRDWIDRDWSHRMSARGVMLFHGANAALEQGGAEGFLARLAELHPTFHLDSGDGMLVVLRGAQPEDRLTRLCQMGIGDPGYAAVLQVFGRLGTAIRAEMTARQESLRAEDLRQRADQAERDLAQSRKAEEDSRAALAKLNVAYDERNRQVAVIQGKLVDLQQGRADQTAAKEALSAQLAEATAHLAAAAEREAALAARLDSSVAELAKLEALRTDLETSQNKQTWLRKERELLQAEEADLRRALQVASDEGQTRIAALEARIKTLQTAAETARTEAQALTEDRDAQAAEAQTRAETIAALTQQLEQAQAEADTRLQALTEDRDARAAEAQTRSETIATLTQQLEQAQAEADARLHAPTKDRDARAAEAQTRAETIAALTQQLEQAQAEADARLQALTEDRDAQAAEAQTRAEAIATLTQQLEQATIGLESQRADWEGQRDNLQRQTRALAAERDAIEADLETVRTENAALSDQLAALSGQLAAQDTLVRQQQQDHAADRAAEQARHAQEVQDLTTRLEAAQLAAETQHHAMQPQLQAQQANIRDLTDRLAQAQAQEASSLATLTTSFETRQIATDQQRDEMLRELRTLREAEEQTRQELLALQTAQAAQERLFAQTRTLLEDDVENLQALLRDQLAVAERLRAASEQDKVASAALRTERDEARAQAKALDDTIAQVLNSTSWKLTAPMRKMLESVRST